MKKKVEISVVDLTTQNGKVGILWRGEFYPKVSIHSRYRTVDLITGLSPQEYIDWIRRDSKAVHEAIKEKCQEGDEGVLMPITVIPKEEGYVIKSEIIPLPEGFDLDEFRNQKLS